jgi:hypothetical protein
VTCETGIYLITHLGSGRHYVGMTGVSFGARWKQQIRALNNDAGESPRLQKAWNKYGQYAFGFSIFKLVPQGNMNIDEFYDLLFQEERRAWLSFRETLNTDEPSGTGAVRHGPETRAKIRAALNTPQMKLRKRLRMLGNTNGVGNKSRLGQRLSMRTREKMSIAQRGRTASAETRKKLSIAKRGNTFGKKNKGRIFSAETIEKLKQAGLQRPKASEATRQKLRIATTRYWAKRRIDRVSEKPPE